MTQTGLINSILSDIGITADCKVSYTPSDQVLHPDTIGPPHCETWNYRSIIGKLNFLAQNTRPDISMAVHNCGRFCTKPTQLHETTIKRLCRYLFLLKARARSWTQFAISISTCTSRCWFCLHMAPRIFSSMRLITFPPKLRHHILRLSHDMVQQAPIRDCPFNYPCF